MAVADEIREAIANVEQLPDSRLKVLRLTGLRVLLARHEPKKDQDS